MWADHRPTYCLACHKVMVNPEPVCPRCGADQETVRAELIEKLQAPPARRGLKREPPLPLNAVDTVACPSCHTPVPAGTPSCSFCGHTMLTDLPKWMPDGVAAKRYLIAGFVLALVGLLLMVSGNANRFSLGALMVMSGLVFGITGFGRNPLGWTENFMLGAVLLVGMFAVIMMFALMFMGVL